MSVDAKYVYLGVAVLAALGVWYLFAGMNLSWNAWRTASYGSSISYTQFAAGEIMSVMRLDVPMHVPGAGELNVPFYYVAVPGIRSGDTTVTPNIYAGTLFASSLGSSMSSLPIGYKRVSDGYIFYVIRPVNGNTHLLALKVPFSAFKLTGSPLDVISSAQVVKDYGTVSIDYGQALHLSSSTDLQRAVSACVNMRSEGVNLDHGACVYSSTSVIGATVASLHFDEGHCDQYLSEAAYEIELDSNCEYHGVSRYLDSFITDAYAIPVGRDVVFLMWGPRHVYLYSSHDGSSLSLPWDVAVNRAYISVSPGSANGFYTSSTPGVYVKDDNVIVSVISAGGTLSYAVYDAATGSVVRHGQYDVPNGVVAAVPYYYDGTNPAFLLVAYDNQSQSLKFMSFTPGSSVQDVATYGSDELGPFDGVQVLGFTQDLNDHTVMVYLRVHDIDEDGDVSKYSFYYFPVQYDGNRIVSVQRSSSTIMPGAYVKPMDFTAPPISDGRYLPIAYYDPYVAVLHWGRPDGTHMVVSTSVSLGPGVVFTMDQSTTKIVAWNDQNLYLDLNVCGQAVGAEGTATELFVVSVWRSDYSVNWRTLVPVTFGPEYSCKVEHVVVPSDANIYVSSGYSGPVAFTSDVNYKVYVYNAVEYAPVYWNAEPQDAVTYVGWRDVNMASFASEPPADWNASSTGGSGSSGSGTSGGSSSTVGVTPTVSGTSSTVPEVNAPIAPQPAAPLSAGRPSTLVVVSVLVVGVLIYWLFVHRP